ncbi:MAG: carboxymuconolactone decarboxylase family protein [Candidatus Binatia bacterium]|nr:carboxymuconolactone decarboxylase family protein [Candidatus Binatia bacterium]
MSRLPHHGRLEPLTPTEWGERTGQTLSGTVERVSKLEGEGVPPAEKPLNILATIARHPSLLEPFLAWSATLALQGELSRRDSEMLALRAAWNCRSPFEWGHHVLYARAAGLNDEEIERIARGPASPGWAPEDADLLRAADELHSGQDLSPETWARLRPRFSDAQLVEIPFVVGQYTMLSMVANSTGVPIEDGLSTLPELD